MQKFNCRLKSLAVKHMQLYAHSVLHDVSECSQVQLRARVAPNLSNCASQPVQCAAHLVRGTIVNGCALSKCAGINNLVFLRWGVGRITNGRHHE